MEWAAWAFFIVLFFGVVSAQVYKMIILEREPLPYRYHDGGRKKANFENITGDCVTRSIAIATGYQYSQVHSIVDSVGKRSGYKNNDAENGVNGYITDALMDAFGGVWYGVPKGTYLRKGMVPETGIVIVQLHEHVLTVIDGVIYDNHSTDVKQEMYGYWVFPDKRTGGNVR